MTAAVDHGGVSDTVRPLPRASLAIAALSTVVEWYDFTIFLYLSPLLARVFYGGDAGLGFTLGTFAAAYALRPLGALVFGRLGDRHGRRRTMLVSMAVITAAMLLTACLPTRAAAGALAGWGLLAARALAAFAVGGEYTGVVAYLLEGAPTARRGLLTACAAAASEVGGLLAAAVAALLTMALAPASLDDWGWRIPFLIGAALAAVVLLARATMVESPEFLQQRRDGTLPTAPATRVLAHHRGAVALGFAISALGSITYYVGVTYVPAFLDAARAPGSPRLLWLPTLAAALVILVTPAIGHLSDRVGRRPVLIAAALAALVLPPFAFAAMATTPGAALAGAAVLALLGGAVSAVGAVASAEAFPGAVRLTGLALGVTTATAIFGGAAPYAAHRLFDVYGAPAVPGLLIAAVALCVLPVFAAMRETAPARITPYSPNSSPISP